MIATATTNPWVGPAIVAAVVSGVVALATVALAGRRERKDRHRILLADAFAKCQLYKEYPFIVRRRRSDEEAAADRSRISQELNRVQVALNDYKARLKVETPYLAGAYEALVGATRRVAGAEIRRSWDVSPTAGDDQHITDIDLAELGDWESHYLEHVKDHLSLWPYWACRSVRQVAGRTTALPTPGPAPSDPAAGPGGGGAVSGS